VLVVVAESFRREVWGVLFLGAEAGFDTCELVSVLGVTASPSEALARAKALVSTDENFRELYQGGSFHPVPLHLSLPVPVSSGPDAEGTVAEPLEAVLVR